MVPCISGLLPEFERLAASYSTGEVMGGNAELAAIMEFPSRFAMLRFVESQSEAKCLPIAEVDKHFLGLTPLLHVLPEYKLFMAIARLAFNADDLDVWLEVVLSPCVVGPLAESWLREGTECGEALPLVKQRLGECSQETYQVLCSAESIAVAESVEEAWHLHMSVFEKILMGSISAEMKHELGRVVVALVSGVQAGGGYVEVLESALLGESTDAVFDGIVHADDHIILVENGLCNLERVAQAAGEEAFARLCCEMTKLGSCAKLTVVRYVDTQDESIFYTLLKHRYPRLYSSQDIHSINCASAYKSEFIVQCEDKPSRYSPTAIAKLMVDPYSYCAEYVLKLRPCDKVWDNTAAKEFGVMVHKLLEGGGCFDDDGVHRALEMVEELINKPDAAPQQMLMLRERLVAIIKFMRHHYSVAPMEKVCSEVEGSVVLIGDRRFGLKARADRIECDGSGGVRIIDFKTGAVPYKWQVERGVAPQLVVEAIIQQEGGFGVAGADVELYYANVCGRESMQEFVRMDVDVEVGRKSLCELLNSFAQEEQAYFAVPHALEGAMSRFNHLRRVE